MGCAVCDEAVRATIREGNTPQIIDGAFLPQDPSNGTYTEGLCSVCQARGRTRALATLLTRSAPLIRSNAPTLVASADEHQLPVYRRHFTNLTHVSLHGDFGDPSCIVGVDLRDLSRFPDRRFTYFFAVCVLDYIPEALQVFREVHRVLKRGGSAIFNLMPVRVGDFDQPVTVRNCNALKHEAYSPTLADGTTGIPDCRFDRRSLLNWMAEAGFKADHFFIKDHLSDLRFGFFTGRA